MEAFFMHSFRNDSLRRLVFDGILIALFFALSLLSVEIGGIKLTFDSLAVVIAAVLFGPLDAFIVGFLGALLEQMLHYGFTVTTILWMLPPACRGLLIALGLRLNNASKKTWQYLCVCLAAGAVTSCLNTLVYYIDSKLMGYYAYALIFGVFYVRLAAGLLTAAITAMAALPILKALRKTGLFEERNRQ